MLSFVQQEVKSGRKRHTGAERWQHGLQNPSVGVDHDGCALKLYDTPVRHGPGDITIYNDEKESLKMFADWASRKVKFKTPCNDLGRCWK